MATRTAKKTGVSDRSSKSIMRRFKLMEVCMWIVEPMEIIDKSVINHMKMIYDAFNKN